MRMYTEIIFGAALKQDIPSDVLAVVQSLVDGVAVENPPDHPFFASECPWLLQSGGSYYFPGEVPPSFWYDPISQRRYLHFRTSTKNYDNEIQKFLDWIRPYLCQGSGERDFYAIVTYECDDTPTIYYLEDE